MECKVMGELDHPDRYGRIYSKDAVEKAVKNFNGKAYRFGELGYPTTQQIDLGKISHEVNGVSFDGSALKANIQLLDTPAGKIAQQILNSGREIKIRPRVLTHSEKVKKGRGKHTNKEVITEMEIISFDIV